MAKNITALKNLYKQLGGDPEDVQDCSTITEVLNAISGKYDGETDAMTNPDAIDNIAAVAENIGYPEPTGTKSITANGTHDVKDYASAEVAVPAAGITRKLIIKVTSSSSNSGHAVTIQNQYKLNKDGYFALDGSGISIVGYTIMPSKELELERSDFYASNPNIVGHYLYDFILVKGGNQTSSISLGETNCTASIIGTFGTTGAMYAVIKVEGLKSNEVVSSPYITIVTA